MTNPEYHIFSAEELNIESVFSREGSAKIIYRIPNYQRHYAWGEVQVRRMLKDIQRAVSLKKEMYFLSAIVVCDRGTEGSNKAIEEVVDGQQRLITLTVIMQELLHKIPPYDTLRGQLMDCIKIRVGEEDLKRIETSNSKDKDWLEIYLDNESEEVSLPNDSLLNVAKKTIQKTLKELNESDQRSLGKFIIDNLCLIKIKTTSRSEACQIFESLNDTGLPLTTYDKIKNRLFLLSSENSGKEIERHISEMEARFRNESTKNIVEDYVDTILRVNYLESFIDPNEIYDEFKSTIDTQQSALNFARLINNNENILAFLASRTPSLNHQALISIKEQIDNLDQIIYFFNRIKDKKIFSPSLFSLFYHRNTTEIDSAIRDMYCILSRNKGIPSRLSDFQELLAPVAYDMYHDKNVSFSKNLRKIIENDDELIIDKVVNYRKEVFKSQLQYQQTIKEEYARNILFDICFLSPSNPMQKFQPNSRKISLEHILPQDYIALSSLKPRQKEYFKSFERIENHQGFMRRLGNLTILLSEDNSSAGISGKKKFEEIYIREEYEPVPVVSDITSYLQRKKWTQASIMNRQVELVEKYTDLVKFSWEK